MSTRALTVGQAIVEFMVNQWVERDGERQRFFHGCFGIFGHGNVAGLGEALLEHPEMPYYQTRNEQAMVHTAAGFAKARNRLGAFACTSSIGPGATNMVTAAAGATINRLPVLVLPGDIFATRPAPPVLQQLESPASQDVSVNDCFKPVSRYWDRIMRPEQLPRALLEAMRVLTSPADTGAVTLALPQDVQAEAHAFPAELFEERVWTIPRIRPDEGILRRAAEAIRRSERPMIVAGGGVKYSDATTVLAGLAGRTGIPVAETFAGKGSLPYDDPRNLGAVGATGTPGAAEIAAEADLVIGIGTRYTDFTTSSESLWQNPDVSFVNINVAEFDAFKQSALPVVGDARVTLEALDGLLAGYAVPAGLRARAADLSRSWDETVSKIYSVGGTTPVRHAEVIGAVNDAAGPSGTVVCAAGSLPGDLHKLWRTSEPDGFHLEYGYSCMGYEIAGGLGVKMADPGRDVYVMVGDGSYLMLSNEIVTSVQEGYKLIVVVLDNHGYGSIGALSESVGCRRFGTRYRVRDAASGQLEGEPVKVDFAANARSLGAHSVAVCDIAALREALAEAKLEDRTTVVAIETDLFAKEAGYSWWEVPVAEASSVDTVAAARAQYSESKRKQRQYL